MDSDTSSFDSSVSDSSEAPDDIELSENADDEETELYESDYDPSEYEEELFNTDAVKNEKTGEYEAVISKPENQAVKTNDKGQPVEEMPLYAYDNALNYEDKRYLEDGVHMVNYPENNGFEGECETVQLNSGTVVARYGSENGHFGTQKGADASRLGVPYDTDTMEYHEYRVSGNLETQMGKIAPAYSEENGGETQYVFSSPFAEMVENGQLEKIR